MSVSLAEVLRRFGQAYLCKHAVSAAQARAWRAILSCRTQALGGARLDCEGCGATQWRWRSCRNRHCPVCQKQAQDAWRSARMAELLNVPYTHMVFTLPHELNGLARSQPRWVYETLLSTAAQTLTEFSANERWLGGRPAFTLVLHTWTQDLRVHLHAHALIAAGALDRQGQWVEPKRGARFLFPVAALSKVFAGKFCAQLQAAQQDGRLSRDAERTTGEERRQRLRALRSKAWVVYAKTPMTGPAQVLDYLSRYTHRTAIGAQRLVNADDERIWLSVRADEQGGKRIVRIPGEQFIGRFLQHILPSGFKRIRHYGLLSSARKTKDLAQARSALLMPAANPIAREQAAQFMKRIASIDIDCCPRCHLRWSITALAPMRDAGAPGRSIHLERMAQAP
jgi:hypothetical protein